MQLAPESHHLPRKLLFLARLGRHWLSDDPILLLYVLIWQEVLGFWSNKKPVHPRQLHKIRVWLTQSSSRSPLKILLLRLVNLGHPHDTPLQPISVDLHYNNWTFLESNCSILVSSRFIFHAIFLIFNFSLFPEKSAQPADTAQQHFFEFFFSFLLPVNLP